MKHRYRRLLKNPTALFILFYTLLIWRVLMVYFHIDTLSLLIVLLVTAVTLLLYEAFRGVVFRKKRLLSMAILLVSLCLIDLIDTHITYALYRMDGITWRIDPGQMVPLYPLAMFAWLYVQDRVFHPLGMVITLPFILFCWFALIQEQMKVWIVLYLFLALVECAVWVYAHARRSCRGQGLHANLHKRMMIGTALAVLVLAPAIFLPLTCFGTKNINDILNSGQISRYVSEFNLHSLGYGNESSLGGSVDLDDTILMKIQADGPMYLRGNVKDRYTGHAWEKTLSDITNLSKTAVHEVDMDSPAYQDGTEASLRIYPAVPSSAALFTPLSATYLYSRMRVGFDKYYIYYNIGSGYKIGPYTVTYKDMTYPEHFDYTAEEVSDRYARYLQLPEDISRRLVALVDDITGDAFTVSAKVDAIRRYLTENFTYSLTVETPPGDMDFVEHFVFEEKRGYCTYFATSAAVMCRIAGIPARYVQGFKIDEDRTDPEGRYILTGREAHAWVEILVSPGDRLWETVECTPEWADGTGTGVSLYEPTPPPFGSAAPVDMTLTPHETGGGGFIRRHLLLCVVIAAAVLGLTGYAVVKIQEIRKRKNEIFTARTIVPLYLKIRERLREAGIFTDDTMSDREEAASIADGELRAHVEPIVSRYYDEYYGGIKGDPEPALRKEAYRYIIAYVKKNKRRIVRDAGN